MLKGIVERLVLTLGRYFRHLEVEVGVPFAKRVLSIMERIVPLQGMKALQKPTRLESQNSF